MSSATSFHPSPLCKCSYGNASSHSTRLNPFSTKNPKCFTNTESKLATSRLPIFFSSLWNKEGMLILENSTYFYPYCMKKRNRLSVCSEFFTDVIHNQALMSATAACVSAQLLKPFFSFINGNDFNIKLIIKSGGMPSSHSAVVTSLATAIELERGASDSLFGLAIVYACIVMYDAQGVRRAVGKQAEVINTLLVPTLAYQMTSSPSPSPSPSPLNPDYDSCNPLNPLQDKTSQPITSMVADKEDEIRNVYDSSKPSSSSSSSTSSRPSFSSRSSKSNGVGIRSEEGEREREGDGSHGFEERVRSKQFWEEAMVEPSVKKGEVEKQEIGNVEGWRHIPLKESVGHSKLEVIVGGMYGIILGLLMGQLY